MAHHVRFVLEFVNDENPEYYSRILTGGVSYLRWNCVRDQVLFGALHEKSFVSMNTSIDISIPRVFSMEVNVVAKTPGIALRGWLYEGIVANLHERFNVAIDQIVPTPSYAALNCYDRALSTLETGRPWEARMCNELVVSQTPLFNTLTAPQREALRFMVGQEATPYSASKWIWTYAAPGDVCSELCGGKQLMLSSHFGMGWAGELYDDRGGMVLNRMGFGKTVVVIACILAQAHMFRTLLVVPSELVRQWQKEFAKFAPGLKVMVIHKGGACVLDEVIAHRVIITTPQIMDNQRFTLRKVKWDRLVCDEAHKYPKKFLHAREITETCNACCSRWLMTGTPFQDHDAVLYRSYIGLLLHPSVAMIVERKHASEALSNLAVRHSEHDSPSGLQPYILHSREVELCPDHLKEYNALRASFISQIPQEEALVARHMLNSLRKFVATGEHSAVEAQAGPAVCAVCEGQIDEQSFEYFTCTQKHCCCESCMDTGEVLLSCCPTCSQNSCVESLLTLAQGESSSCDAIEQPQARDIRRNARSRPRINLVVEDILNRPSEAVVVFTQYRRLAAEMHEALGEICINTFDVHNLQAFNRKVEKFQNHQQPPVEGPPSKMSRTCKGKRPMYSETDEPRVLIVPYSRSAVGLNLTRASVVVLLDQHLSAATETQAIHRCQRRGQQNQVSVIKYIARGTVEEAIRQFTSGETKPSSRVQLCKSSIKAIMQHKAVDNPHPA